MAFGTANPTVGGSRNTWGTTLNTILDSAEDWAKRFHSCFDITYPDNDTYTLCINSRFPFAIDQLTYKTNTGTCTVSVLINGVAVTGLSSLSVTSTEQTASATAANSVAIGDDVTIVISSVAGGVTHLLGNLWVDRTDAGTA